MKRRRIALTVAAVALVGAVLQGCSSPKLSDYANREPKLDLVDFFAGRSDAWGMVQQRDGLLLRHFYASIEGRMEGEKLILDEQFVFDDGEKQSRVWTFTPVAPQRWSGVAHDVVGTADLQTAGNAVHLRYTLQVPVSGRVIDMSMDDWMFQLDDKTLVNRTSMRKWGVELGELTVFFRKQDAGVGSQLGNTANTPSTQ